MTPTAVLSSVTVEYPSLSGKVTALHDIDVTFRRGSATAIVGRSGSGKSTLVSVLSLLRSPSAGEVYLNGVRASTLTRRELAALRSSEIGIAFQSSHLEGSLTAAENVALPQIFKSSSTSLRSSRHRALEVLDRLDIAELADRRPNEMSGGQRQRVAIARALISDPALFIADEPTGNLDEETANDVAELILGLPSRFGTTVVVATHDTTIASMAGRRLELSRGELTLPHQQLSNRKGPR